MTRRLKLPMAFGLVAAMLLVSGAERAGAIVYKASLLSVTGYNNPNAIGISGTSIIGLGAPVSGDGGSFRSTIRHTALSNSIRRAGLRSPTLFPETARLVMGLDPRRAVTRTPSCGTAQRRAWSI